MSECERIASQLRLAHEGAAWHGPSVRELLSDVEVDSAARRPIEGAHTIWEIAEHIAFWQEAVRHRLQGEAPPDPPRGGDWPSAPDARSTAWEETRRRLGEGNRLLREAILALDEARLSDPVPGKAYTVYDMLHGLIQHNLYHAGQIAVLKRAGSRRAPGAA